MKKTSLILAGLAGAGLLLCDSTVLANQTSVAPVTETATSASLYASQITEAKAKLEQLKAVLADAKALEVANTKSLASFTDEVTKAEAKVAEEKAKQADLIAKIDAQKAAEVAFETVKNGDETARKAAEQKLTEAKIALAQTSSVVKAEHLPNAEAALAVAKEKLFNVSASLEQPQVEKSSRSCNTCRTRAGSSRN